MLTAGIGELAAFGTAIGWAVSSQVHGAVGRIVGVSGVTLLRDMQRAWMAYRDATCGYEGFQWYGGTGATGAYLGCNLRLTGQQVLFLWSMMASG